MYGSIFYNPLMIWLLFFFNQFLLLLGLILALRLGYGIRIRVGSLFEGRLFVVYLVGGIILSIIDTVAYTSNRYLVASEVLPPVTGLIAFLIIYISTVGIALVIAYMIFNRA